MIWALVWLLAVTPPITLRVPIGKLCPVDPWVACRLQFTVHIPAHQDNRGWGYAWASELDEGSSVEQLEGNRSITFFVRQLSLQRETTYVLRACVFRTKTEFCETRTIQTH